MARQTLILCDADDCRNIGKSYRLWADGDKRALAVDLCDEHVKPLLEFFERSTLVELPVKQRVRMEVTKLRTMPETARFKKQP